MSEIAHALYSRVPVFSGRRDNIIGMLLMHDVLAATASQMTVLATTAPDGPTVSPVPEGGGSNLYTDPDIGGRDEEGSAGVGGSNGDVGGRRSRSASRAMALAYVPPVVSVKSCMYQLGSLPRFEANTRCNTALMAFKSAGPNLGASFPVFWRVFFDVIFLSARGCLQCTVHAPA